MMRREQVWTRLCLDQVILAPGRPNDRVSERYERAGPTSSNRVRQRSVFGRWKEKLLDETPKPHERVRRRGNSGCRENGEEVGRRGAQLVLCRRLEPVYRPGKVATHEMRATLLPRGNPAAFPAAGQSCRELNLCDPPVTGHIVAATRIRSMRVATEWRVDG
jgi:hypothetical protein